MHLTLELQKQLNALNSSVQPAAIIDGTFPDRYAFCNTAKRCFRAEYTSTDHEFSIVLFERTDKHDYEYCFARGLFTNLTAFATVIDLWIDKRKNITDIKEQFDELELFVDFEIKNHNNEIDKKWTKVKNMLFNELMYWKYPDWENRYIELLYEAKKHQAFEKYYPFTSHYWLRFSIDNELTQISDFHLYAIPTTYSEEVPLTYGKFYVSYNDKPMGGQFFDTAKDALDFYAEKLRDTAPFKC